MPANNLGKISKVEFRKAWNHEASDFTNWLAEEENLRLLSDEIGIDIKLIQTEASVGKFNVDILAEEENTGKKIVIENQLEATNHDHLGKIITYASGYEANIVIWVVKEAREEHRQAVDWLNEHTDEDLAFFLIQIELWQIGMSPFAPKFEMISKPNDWAKTIKQSVGSNKVTETKAQQLQFWEQFKNYAKDHNTNLRLQKAYPHHWMNVSIGSSHAHMALSMSSFDEVMRTELYIPDNKEIYNFLYKQRDKIEKEFGMKLEWMELPERKASRIKVETSGLIDNTDEWETYFAWLQKTAEDFQRVFSKILKKYK
ncbi:MAG: hypothetical protein COV34_01215 [Candidatus Zambryskibacteria bacterium CG10_big_fil_rev_8_21_14_0_10_42_12]|uniref:DUF4268 domain-containing protein n=1 Tax=Candidatus Zambryskibacteria bacterium CG10_big_fil_rev_8_21_14_0_10_42_12 TaxID=1975115 RepID=A0A2H0QW75_9BACT|nr:MAG: hypothetical protein COV34_01215 [Candidatus Zambryskibacteria bacterium CG10_big_fil_rev_8_21_14_0_10_42_12]